MKFSRADSSVKIGRISDVSVTNSVSIFRAYWWSGRTKKLTRVLETSENHTLASMSDKKMSLNLRFSSGNSCSSDLASKTSLFVKRKVKHLVTKQSSLEKDSEITGSKVCSYVEDSETTSSKTGNL
jgi:hypothetical protein